MKNLGKLLKPKNLFIGAVTFFSLCDFSPYYGFNLSGLEDWQAELFLEAGRSQGAYTFRDNSSKNIALLGKLFIESLPKLSKGEKYIAIANPVSDYSICLKGNFFNFCNILGFARYEVIFKEDENWVNCDIEGTYGVDFYNISIHEWGHVLSKKHSKNPKEIMHRNPHQRC